MNPYIFIFPSSSLNANIPDELFCEEFNALKACEFECFLYNSEKFNQNKVVIKNSENMQNKIAIYRGWMLKKEEYKILSDYIINNNATMFTDLTKYLYCHYMPNWYNYVKEFTPKTTFIYSLDNIDKMINSLNEEKLFIKDFVKSVNINGGSIANNKKDIERIISDLKFYRGDIEGGLCIRKFEEFIPNTEERFFVFNGKIFSRNNIVPEIVNNISNKINANFYSIDIAKNIKNTYRLIEIGDGQVSGLKNWSIDSFIKIFNEIKTK